MTSTKEICRTCLDVIDSDFDTLNANKAEMLKLISIDLDLTLTDKPLVCSQCASTLQQSFDFKMTCLNNEDYLKTFVHCDSSIKLNLEEVIVRSAVEHNIKHEEESICRLCLRYLDVGAFVKLDDVEEDIFLRDMLHKCLPEIDLNLTNVPLMCYDCMEKLQKQFNFVTACVDNNERIKSYVEANGTNNNDTVDLGNVINFVDEYKRVGDHYLNYVKVETVTEHSNVTDGGVVKEEDASEAEYPVKMEENLSLEIESEAEAKSPEVSRRMPYAKSYSCTECSHTTNRKDSLEIHYLVHRALSKSELLKCEKCDFHTKWKSSLSKHFLLHVNPTDLVKYKCARCPYESKYKNHLRRHCKNHLDTNLYRCQHCWFTTADRTYFKRHNKIKHDNVVTFQNDTFSCNDCIFQSDYKSELDSHRKKAHNVAKYVCDCGYSSSKLYHFQQHSLRHKSDNDVVLFGCDACDFQTKYKKSLKSHVALHKAGKVPLKRGQAKGRKCLENGAE